MLARVFLTRRLHRLDDSMPSQRILGELVTGLGKASDFTSLDWARGAFRTQLAIDPYPGTVNLLVRSDQQRKAWQNVKSWPGIIIPPPRPDWCNSRCYKVKLADSIDAAIILPEVDSYPDNQIELIAAIAVRTTLELVDGDNVMIDVSKLQVVADG